MVRMNIFYAYFVQLEYSHELVRLNCQGAQQTKLIDFLQSRVEELEPSDKKKKKVSSNQGWEKSIFDIAILYFLFIECNGALTFFNEYQIWPCLYFSA